MCIIIMYYDNLGETHEPRQTHKNMRLFGGGMLIQRQLAQVFRGQNVLHEWAGFANTHALIMKGFHFNKRAE